MYYRPQVGIAHALLTGRNNTVYSPGRNNVEKLTLPPGSNFPSK